MTGARRSPRNADPGGFERNDQTTSGRRSDRTAGDEQDATRAGAIRFEEAGALLRATTARVCAARLGTVEMRVLFAVVDRTLSFSKRADVTSTRQLASIVYGVHRDEVKGWQRADVSRALHTLHDRGLIGVELGTGAASRALVWIAEREGDDTRERERDDTRSGRERESDSNGTCVDSLANVRGIAATPRNTSEKYTYDAAVAERVELVLQHLDSKARRSVDRARLSRIVADHDPSAPMEMLAAAAVGEPTPYLRRYRRADAVNVETDSCATCQRPTPCSCVAERKPAHAS